MITREYVYEALFNLLKTVPGFATYTRNFQLWNEFGPAAQPTLIMVGTNQQVTQDASGLRPVWTLSCDLVIYCQSPDKTKAPLTALNNLIDSIESKLQPFNVGSPDRPVQVLGDTTGNIRNCWINGSIQIIEGTLQEGQAVAIIPIEIRIIQ